MQQRLPSEIPAAVMQPVQPMQGVAYDVAAMRRIRICEFRIQLLDPAQECLLSFWFRPDPPIFVTRHGISLEESSNIAQCWIGGLGREPKRSPARQQCSYLFLNQHYFVFFDAG